MHNKISEQSTVESHLIMACHNGLVLLEIILLLCTIDASEPLMCDQCGNFGSDDYPFGIGEGCYFDKSFEVFCDNSSGSPKPLLKSINLNMLLNFVFQKGLIAVEAPVISLNSSKSMGNAKGVNLTGTPFSFSQKNNKFTAAGCDSYAKLNQKNDSSNSGKCQSVCTCDPTQYADCCDLLCTVPPNTKVFDTNSSYKYYQSIPQECSVVFVVEQEWLFNNYQTNSVVLKDQEQVPAVLEWGKYKGTCTEEYNSHTKMCNKDNHCLLQLGTGHFCLCDYTRSVASRHCAGTCFTYYYLFLELANEQNSIILSHS